MPYNPTLHHRRSIRLKCYDYSSQGAYFVTLCTQNREDFFGYIENGILHPNAAGEMVKRWYAEVTHKFANVICDEMVVMPDHFHCIWHITEQIADVDIPTVVQWFKTMTTNEYIHGVKEKGWKPFNKRLWQRNYYEAIIRNEQAYENIRNYIRTNPARADLRVCPLGDGTDDIGADTQVHPNGSDPKIQVYDHDADDIGAGTQDRPNGPDPKAQVRADLRVCPYDHDDINK